MSREELDGKNNQMCNYEGSSAIDRIRSRRPMSGKAIVVGGSIGAIDTAALDAVHFPPAATPPGTTGERTMEPAESPEPCCAGAGAARPRPAAPAAGAHDARRLRRCRRRTPTRRPRGGGGGR